jgi:hypothetical protein
MPRLSVTFKWLKTGKKGLKACIYIWTQSWFNTLKNTGTTYLVCVTEFSNSAFCMHIVFVSEWTAIYFPTEY